MSCSYSRTNIFGNCVVCFRIQINWLTQYRGMEEMVVITDLRIVNKQKQTLLTAITIPHLLIYWSSWE